MNYFWVNIFFMFIDWYKIYLHLYKVFAGIA